MEVVKILTEEGKERYYLADDNGLPVESVLKFIRFKDHTNYARNTLRMYCQHLKLYFEYLQQLDKDFQAVTIDDLAQFVSWLQNPCQSLKVIPMDKITSARTPHTVNVIVNTVLAFYDYALRHDEYSSNISERLKKLVTIPSRNVKGFLYGIAYEKKISVSNILRLKEPLKRPKTLTHEQIEELHDACCNDRDRFLIVLLYETGLRIGETLSLWIEDFDLSTMQIDLKDRGYTENHSEIKTVSSPRLIDVSQHVMDLFMEYLCHYHTEEVLTNHLFVKISGKSSRKAMEYVDVDNLFRMLRRKTGIYVTSHMFRHTSLTTLRQAGWEPELLRIRAGHKNIYTTLNTYVHPSLEDLTLEFEKTHESLALSTQKDGGRQNGQV